MTHFRKLSHAILNPWSLHANSCITDGPFVYVTKASVGVRPGIDCGGANRACIRRGEHSISAAYTFQFPETLYGSRAGEIKAIENLCLVECRVRRSDVAAYIVQIVNEPYQVIRPEF